MIVQPNHYTVEMLTTARMNERQAAARQHRCLQALRREDHAATVPNTANGVPQPGWIWRVRSALAHART
jgi:hypothetical protein